MNEQTMTSFLSRSRTVYFVDARENNEREGNWEKEQFLCQTPHTLVNDIQYVLYVVLCLCRYGEWGDTGSITLLAFSPTDV
jgi:hypothetical protein